LIGLYFDGNLVQEWSSDEKISDALLPLLLPILDMYDINSIIYTSGPGSHMATKLTFVTLKTIEIAMGIPCVGCSGFDCNNNRPIKAMGNLYFVKEKETIITKKFDQVPNMFFALPKKLQDITLDFDAMPLHILPAV
jgi:tRNA A37 threonylcarbamoyladenosine modification protein TsaB